MEAKDASAKLKDLFHNLYCLDIRKQKASIETYYDKQCRLQNPYMILVGRDEIIHSFASLSNQTIELKADVQSIEFDPVAQTATVHLEETLNPKALGGLLPIKIHQSIKLQLERGDPEASSGHLLYITDHHEVHAAQEYISRVPIMGSLYEGSMREVIGKVFLTGSSILDATGIMDYVPLAVHSALNAANATRSKVEKVAEGAVMMGTKAAEMTGVSQLIQTAGVAVNTTMTTVSHSVHSTVSSVSHTVSSTSQTITHVATDATNKMVAVAKQTALLARLQAARWIEESQGKHVHCYSPTCVPGIQCYAPSCERNKPDGGFSLQQVVTIVYQGIVKKLD